MDINGSFYCSRCMRPVERDAICPHCGYVPSRAQSAAWALPEGAVLAGRYQLGAVIGSGGFGLTYAAWDDVLKAPRAVKEYFPRDFATRNPEECDDAAPENAYLADYAVGLRRFIRESQVLAMFQDVPGIVRVYDCFEENNTAYIAMEYVRGETLDAYAKSQNRSPKALLRAMRQPIDALASIHRQGVLHRDITPRNILVTPDGGAKLIDFGSAGEIAQKGGTILVTRHYAALEQYDSAHPQGPWTDVYGVCAALYEALTGRAPQESVLREHRDELVSLRKNAKISAREANAIMAGLAVRPEKRPQSMEELRALIYHLPMPQDVIHRKRLVRRFCAVSAAALVVSALAIVNFTCGLPLGGGYLYALFPSGLRIVGETGASGAIRLPERRLGIPVTEVAESAFKGNSRITEIEIPGGVKKIGALAFSRCENLRALALSDGVREIGDYAFANCPSLHTAKLPLYIKSAGKDIFIGAWPRLTLWGWPNSFAQAYARANNYGYASYLDYTYDYAEDGIVINLCMSRDARISMPSYIDGEPVTAIRENAYIQQYASEDCTLAQVDLPEYLVSLPDGIFQYCYTLENVQFGASLRYIGASAFAHTSLHRVELPDGLETIGDQAFFATLKTLGLHTFDRCPKDFVIAGEKNSVAEKLSGLLNYRFRAEDPAGVEISKKGSLSIPENTKSADTRTLPSFFRDRSGENALVSQIKDARQIHCRRAELPQCLNEISSFSFCGVQGLEEVSIANAKKIGYAAFSFCDNLKKAELPKGLEEIGELAFARCPELREIALPDSLVLLGENAFSDCAALETIRIPKSLSTLPDGCFALTGLRCVYVPGNIKLCRAAFYGCEALEAAVLGEGVQELSCAFHSCGALKQITLPASLRRVSPSAFKNCGALEDVWFFGKDTDLNDGSPAEDLFRASGYHITDEIMSVYGDAVSLEAGDAPRLFADCPNVTLHGYEGSTAQAYAQAHGLAFEAIEDAEKEMTRIREAFALMGFEDAWQNLWADRLAAEAECELLRRIEGIL